MAFSRNIALQVYAALYGLMTILLVTRAIPIGVSNIDDEQYLENFTRGLSELDLSSPLALLEEPLWQAYCEILSALFSPAESMRVTILILLVILGLIPVLLRAEGLLFYLLWFTFHPHLAPEIAFNQIRQGLGLAVFLVLVVVTKRIAIPAFIGALVHTSVASLGILAIARRHDVAIAVIIALTFILAFFTAEFGLLFGRRSFYLEEPIELTVNYYVVNLGTLLFFAYLLGKHERRGVAPSAFATLFWGWFYLSISVLIISMYVHFGPRLGYFSAYLLGLLIALGNQKADSGIFYAKLFAILFLVILDTRLEIGGDVNSPIRNWALILGF